MDVYGVEQAVIEGGNTNDIVVLEQLSETNPICEDHYGLSGCSELDEYPWWYDEWSGGLRPRLPNEGTSQVSGATGLVILVGIILVGIGFMATSKKREKDE